MSITIENKASDSIHVPVQHHESGYQPITDIDVIEAQKAHYQTIANDPEQTPEAQLAAQEDEKFLDGPLAHAKLRQARKQYLLGAGAMNRLER